ncbi:PcfB family protein [Lachnospiraceae bacterium]|nr:PcfB family protein [Lachnospiraceae bacterium]
MNTGGEAAEQIVRMSLEGFEVAARITGAGAKNIAILLYSILKEEQKTKGKARLTNMLRSGKELKVFTVKSGDLKKFTQEAKKYGVLYCVLADRKNKDPNAEVDVIARAEDASKISRIVERFSLASVDTASIVTEAEKSKEEKGRTKDAKSAGEKDAGAKDGQPEPDIGVQDKAEKDRLMDALMGKPIQKEENAPNPSLAKTGKSPLSEPTSEQPKKPAEGAIMTKAEKPSVREELRKIKENRKEQESDVSPNPAKEKSHTKKQPAGKTEHKQPQKRKRKPKSKGAR